MDRKNLLFIKNNCALSNKLAVLVDNNYKVISIEKVKLPEELQKYEVPFLIVRNITKPIECERALAYLENLKFFNQQTNNITNKIVQMKPVVSDLDKTGVSKEFNKISDEYAFIEDGKNIEKIHRSLENIDDTNRIDMRTDFNNDTKLKESETPDQLKDMVMNRNRQLQLHLQSRGRR
jgi:hypothetical protein